MAAEFVGYPVVVTLKSPPNCRVQGTVADVVGQRLTLQDGLCCASLLRRSVLMILRHSDPHVEWPADSRIPY